MKYKTKLLIGFGFLLVLMLVLLGTISNALTHLTQNINEIVDDRYMKLKAANNMQNHVNNMSRLVAGIVIDETPQSINKDKRALEESISKASAAFDVLTQKTEHDRTKVLLSQIASEYQIYTQLSRRISELAEAGQKTEAIALINADMKGQKDELFHMIDNVKALQESLLDDAYDRSMEQYEFIKKLSFYLMIFGLLSGSVVTAWVIRGISKNLTGITSIISSVGYRSTDKFPRIPVTSRDEIGDIARAFNEMAQTLEEHAEQEKEFTLAMQEHSWLKTQLADITATYQGVHDINKLAELLIRKLTPLVGASYGVFYIREGQSDHWRFVKAGTFARDSQEIGSLAFEEGEGLVGQCAVENKVIQISKLPEHYVKISSGLGSSAPSSLILVPVSHEGQVLAVLELASFLPFTELQRNLLEEVAGTMGTAINSIFVHMQVRKLLKESQTLTEELQSQSEELQLQQEELRSINEKLEEQYKNSELKARELEKVKEELEKQAEQVQKASRYKSEFLANMSHELRTPLNSLLILSQILSENKEKNLTDKQVEYATTIFTSGKNLLTLINEILDLTKVESGKMEINRGEVSIKSIAIYAERGFRPLAIQKGLGFSVEIADDVPDKLWADEQRLQQIITNLLSNAFKFTSQGEIRLKLSREEIDDIAYVSIAVQDTGIGIPAEKQEIIFEAFQQADGTTSRKYGGTGLGLSISREMAKLLGGFIQVESVEGMGSTFTLYLPIEEQISTGSDPYSLPPVAAGMTAAEDQPPVSVDGEGLIGKKALVVDDDMRNIFALTAALEERKMTVIYAENGREGIQALEDNPDVDIVLMDIMMPEMDGYEAIEAIRRMPSMEKLPIIALTAKAMKHDRERCIEAGASDYISKPVEMEQLISLMRVWLYSPMEGKE
ncbi:ATP-binding protein [Brevibacillus borstelensis]|uniref:ATP-binding protein n=1 Tax=Brevibacillus borstelensis TaxID=45462 RepID=UPI002E20E46B|nr:ATP-binding protein [Brevibacillus borstelensis]